MNQPIQPVVLTGQKVRLESLALTHVPDLASCCLGGESPTVQSIWQYIPYGSIRTEDQLRSLIQGFLAKGDLGTDFGFAVVLQESGRAIGCSRYLDIQPQNRALEIGSTWYAPAYQRTGVNTECKFLLLRHAFEVLGYQRVQFKTDLRNERSQRALERIGAIKEGLLRKNMIMPDGYVRSSVSILSDDWPAVKEHLQQLMARSY